MSEGHFVNKRPCCLWKKFVQIDAFQSIAGQQLAHFVLAGLSFERNPIFGMITSPTSPSLMAAGTLLVLDASPPGGLIAGEGNMRYAQTMAFTTLMLFQIFNVFNARSDERSAFAGLFSNKLLWGAVLLSIALQVAVIYTPFLQQTFSTVSLSARDWLRCAVDGGYLAQ